ncbi:hypothetical protein SISNIDRAFT_246527 [Sistotremastrum niveocremeum HHB9708]|uniref:Uncharacterized protein n=1 Tax=Sistotremastrum niveocremeum HHB9708 TaxID=1314777 RepID=A0A164YR48_9AGAM|nr:hypothetical protein SISNIDRAFT_246527 [Sistotremastrum niveocremeum HHB9708]
MRTPPERPAVAIGSFTLLFNIVFISSIGKTETSFALMRVYYGGGINVPKTGCRAEFRSNPLHLEFYTTCIRRISRAFYHTGRKHRPRYIFFGVVPYI